MRRKLETNMASTETTRAVINPFIDLMYGQKRVREAFERYVAEDYVQHNVDTEDGREATLKSVEDYYADHPGLRLEVRRILVDGDIGATHLYIQRSADDPGRVVVDMHRVADGMIVEHWDVIQDLPEHNVGGRSPA
jgi:predicted SnoaL-like aldol condensation-catalyzing enzyme